MQLERGKAIASEPVGEVDENPAHCISLFSPSQA
jgi:hypothetical protein